MRRAWLSLSIKAAVTILLVAWVVERAELGSFLSRLASMSPLPAGAAVLTMAAQLLIAAWRWRLVSLAIAAAVDVPAAMRLTLIGQFFNQTLPSAIGGDAVRAWLAARDTVPLAKAVGGVLADRVVALLALVAISAVMLPQFLERVGAPELRAIMWAMVASAGIGTAVFLALGKRGATILGSWRWTRPLAELAQDLHDVLTSRTHTAPILLLAVVVHLGVIASVWLAAQALGIAVTFVDCAVLVPPIVLLTTLPISVAGWGVREGASVVAFGFVGVPAADALALSVAFGLLQIIVGLPGGLLWLGQDARRRRPAGLKAPGSAP